MAGGKVQHWKHGWIPLTAWARAQVAKREGGDDKNARLLAHRNATADKDAARRQRYNAHLNANADKDAARRQRYNDAQNAKIKSPDQLVGNYRDYGGTPPATKIADRVRDGRPFTYDPTTGAVSGYFSKDTPDLTAPQQVSLKGPTGDRRADLGSFRGNQLALDRVVEGLLRANADALNLGAKIGGRPTGGGYVIGLTRG